MVTKQFDSKDIRQVFFLPSNDYKLDLEIFTISSLLKRKGKDFFLESERVDFHLLLLITESNCTHTVDLEPFECRPGSLIFLHPGQIHRFDLKAIFDGWMVIFRSEFLVPTDSVSLISQQTIFHQFDNYPTHIQLISEEYEAVLDCISRMYKDTKIDANPMSLNILLQNQILALLNRIHLNSSTNGFKHSPPPKQLQHFRRFSSSVEQNFNLNHRVIDYTRLIGCSEKNLNRIVRKITGISAKTFISKRIIIEAKRYLANTDLPVSIIADKLGFNEATNFVKFFKRELGCTPGFFRKGKYLAE
jgi:AraC-like DNA-binding protein